MFRWINYLLWKYFKKDPKIESYSDFRFWNNKLFKKYKGDNYHENIDDDYIH